MRFACSNESAMQRISFRARRRLERVGRDVAISLANRLN
jgi:hypothetical protein